MFSSLLLGVVAFPLSDIDTHQLLPPNSTMVVELHVRRLASEPVLKRIVCLAGTQLYGKLLSRFQLPEDALDELSDLLQKIGIDFWTDVERVTMAGRPRPGWSPFIVLRGDFSRRRLQAAIGRLEQEYPERIRTEVQDSLEVWQWLPGREGPGWHVVLLDAHTLVLSPSRQIVNEAADRALHPQGRPSPPLQLLLERGRSNHLATFVMDGPALLESLPRDFPSESALLNLPENARNVRAVGLGVYFDKGIKLHMSLHMNCADSTRKMRAQLCRWRYEGVSQIKIYYPKGNQCIAKALLGLRFSSDGTVLSMCAALPAETVGQIRQAIAAK